MRGQIKTASGKAAAGKSRTPARGKAVAIDPVLDVLALLELGEHRLGLLAPLALGAQHHRPHEEQEQRHHAELHRAAAHLLRRAGRNRLAWRRQSFCDIALP